MRRIVLVVALACVSCATSHIGELMDFRKRQLKWALEPLRQALESHRRSLEGLESALIKFEETLDGQERLEHPKEQQAQA